ncbi:MAG TPA: M3 family metallopeptidase, partial [Elusimicrobiales bacterium]|nr:M3 family metallopeptidase [Elusimicrobiales bacterium]
MIFKQLALAVAAILCCAAFAFSQKNTYRPSGEPPKFNYTPEEIAKIGGSAKGTFEKKVAAIVGLKPEKRDFSNTVAALDAAVTEYSETTGVPIFLAYVSAEPKVREAASALEEETEKYMVDALTRRDLYNAMKELADTKPVLALEDARLLERTLKDFTRNGLALPDDKLEEYKKLKKELVTAELAFEKNIRDYKDQLELDSAQLAGLPQDYVQKLKKTPQGEYIVTLDYPDYFPFMLNAESDAARKALEFKFNNRCAKDNVALMDKALELRGKIAALLGYKSHADYILDDRMAKNPGNALDFLYQLTAKLKQKARPELDSRLELKRASEPSAFGFHEWDWRYWNNQYRKKKLELDEEKIKEYFPLETVMTGMLSTFEKVYGVKFKNTGLPAWHKDVSAYEIKDQTSGETIAYFYLDLFPREGKYKHAACFGLLRGRMLSDGAYQRPSAAIVANFPKPVPGLPSLFKHDDVVTLFHEFGHVTHNIFTRAKYGRFAGTKVSRDFVEVPSKMSENWAWDPGVLKTISGHYKNPSQKLPDDLIAKKIAAKNADTGMAYLRQTFFSILDLKYHAPERPDTTALYNDLS